MKTVLRVVASMNPVTGGPAEVIRSSATALREHSIHTEVVCVDDPESAFLRNQSYKLHALGPGKYGLAYSPKLAQWLHQNIHRYRAVIIDGLWQYPSWAVTKFFRKSNHSKNPPLFVYSHGMLDPWFQSMTRRPIKSIRNSLYWHMIENQVIKTADSMIFTANEEQRLANANFLNYRPNNESIISIGCQPPPKPAQSMVDALNKVLPSLNGTPYFLFLSRIHPKKGVDLLVSAYVKILRSAKYSEIPDLVIVGPGMETPFGKRVRNMANPYSNKIHFTGMLEGDEKWGAFYGCESYFLPSHQENFGISVTEALGCGKHVFISDKINIYKEIEDNGAGTVESDDLEGTIRLLEKAIDRWRTRNEKNDIIPKQCFDEHFDIKNTTQKLIALIEQYTTHGN